MSSLCAGLRRAFRALDELVARLIERGQAAGLARFDRMVAELELEEREG